jgi:hypothetical protein
VIRLLAHNFPASTYLGETESAELGADLARLSVYQRLREHRHPHPVAVW